MPPRSSVDLLPLLSRNLSVPLLNDTLWFWGGIFIFLLWILHAELVPLWGPGQVSIHQVFFHFPSTTASSFRLESPSGGEQLEGALCAEKSQAQVSRRFSTDADTTSARFVLFPSLYKCLLYSSSSSGASVSRKRVESCFAKMSRGPFSPFRLAVRAVDRVEPYANQANRKACCTRHAVGMGPPHRPAVERGRRPTVSQYHKYLTPQVSARACR